MKINKIISGFPGVGKSYAFNNFKGYKDSDSSNFSWKIVNGEKVRNENFVEDYFNHIMEYMNNDDYDYIFISTHKEIREKLNKENIEFTTVIPDRSRKEEFRKIYNARDWFNATDFIMNNWDDLLNDLEQEKNVITLKEGKFLKDYLN